MLLPRAKMTSTTTCHYRITIEAMTNTTNRKYDLISIGRSGIDLYGDQYGGRLEDMQSFSKYIGGCPANIAIGTSRLGLNVAMITRVGDEQMGRHMVEHLAQNGVDTQYIVMDKERLTTLVLLGIQNATTFPLLYYRQHCADMGLRAEDMKEEAIADAQSILVSGTHLSTPSTAKAIFTAVELAKKHNTKVIFDIDYRPTLWGLTDLGGGESRFVADAQVTEHIQKLLPYCDLIVGTDEEFNIAGGTEEPLESLKNIREITPAVFIYKMGALGCSLVEATVPAELKPYGQSFAIKVLNSVGAGDAFMSGFLSAYLCGKDWNECATRGNASGALVVTRHGCSPASPGQAEIEYFIKNHKQIPEVPDHDPYFKHLHHASSRPYKWNNLHILAFDHRVQFEVMADDAGYKNKKARQAPGKIAEAKQIIHRAFEEARAKFSDQPELQFGLICDDKYGAPVLESAALSFTPAIQARGQGAAKLPLWSARPVEKPLSRPLDFDEFTYIGDRKATLATDSNQHKFATDLGVAIGHFHGRHTIKCLIFHHPDDEKELQKEQMQRLNRLYQLSREHRLELLVEILPPAPKTTGMLSAKQMAESIGLVYASEIFPDWWKIAAMPNQADWDRISKTITKYDPHCRGILLLGADKPLDVLKQEFALAAKQELCRGYAIGRSIFGRPCREWFAGKIDAAVAQQKIYDNFTQIISSWEEAKK